MKYNHMLDITFTMESTEADPVNLPVKDVFSALMRRIATLLAEGYSLGEEIGHCDTYSIEEDE